MFSDDRKVEIASKAKVELTGQPVPLFFGYATQFLRWVWCIKDEIHYIYNL